MCSGRLKDFFNSKGEPREICGLQSKTCSSLFKMDCKLYWSSLQSKLDKDNGKMEWPAPHFES